MTILIIAEHDNATIKAATLNTVAAAQKIGGDIHVLWRAATRRARPTRRRRSPGVAKVLLADAPATGPRAWRRTWKPRC